MGTNSARSSALSSINEQDSEGSVEKSESIKDGYIYKRNEDEVSNTSSEETVEKVMGDMGTGSSNNELEIKKRSTSVDVYPTKIFCSERKLGEYLKTRSKELSSEREGLEIDDDNHNNHNNYNNHNNINHINDIIWEKKRSRLQRRERRTKRSNGLLWMKGKAYMGDTGNTHEDAYAYEHTSPTIPQNTQRLSSRILNNSSGNSQSQYKYKRSVSSSQINDFKSKQGIKKKPSRDETIQELVNSVQSLQKEVTAAQRNSIPRKSFSTEIRGNYIGFPKRRTNIRDSFAWQKQLKLKFSDI